MASGSADTISIEVDFRIEDLERLAPVLRAASSWRSVLAPTSLQRVSGPEGFSEEPWDVAGDLPTSLFAVAEEGRVWAFLRGEQIVATVRRRPKSIAVSLRPGNLRSRCVEAVLELVDILAREGLHPAMITVSRKSGADGDFVVQGVERLDDLPPILYLDDAALVQLGGSDRLRAQLPPAAWREADGGGLLIARADPEREPDAEDWALRDRIAGAVGIAPGRPLVVVESGVPCVPAIAPRPVEEVDRAVRGFERAVLASSVLGGVPRVLDRTVGSLPALERWCAELYTDGEQAQRVGSVADYLAMLARATRGGNVDVAALGVRQTAARIVRGGGLDDFAMRLAATPSAGPVHERVRVFTLKLHVTPWGRPVAQQAEDALFAAVPELAGAQRHTQKRDSWSMIVDSDELRADLGGGTVAVTVRAPASALPARLEELVRAFAPLQTRLGVAYDIDRVASILYLARGAPPGCPGWLIERDTIIELSGEADPFGNRGLRRRWPHRSV